MYHSVKEMVDALNNKLCNHSVSDAMQFQYLEFIETPIGDYIKYMGQCIWYSEDWPWYKDEVWDNVADVQQEIISQMSCIRDVVSASVEAVEQ